MSYGVAPRFCASAATWSAGTYMNSARLSTNLSTSHGQATLSTRGCSRVIHFIVVLPKTPAAAIGSIAEVTQDFLIYVVGALLAAVIVAAVLYWRYPWSRPRGRFGTAAIATFVAWILWRVVLQLSNGDNLGVDNPLDLGELWRELADPAVVIHPHRPAGAF